MQAIKQITASVAKIAFVGLRFSPLNESYKIEIRANNKRKQPTIPS